MDSKPLVSIVMNCYNGEKYLRDSLKSIISQTYENWELIFWDNLSSDNSKKILREFSNSKIKYFKSEKFINLYKARNLAINQCNGDYICFLDTDDLWVKNKLEKQLNFLKINNEFKIVYSNYYILNEKKKKNYIKHHQNLPSGFITRELLDYYSLGLLTVMLEKKFFNNLLFNEKFNIIGDFDFFIKLSENFKIGSIQEPLAYYRIHESNLSNKMNIHISELEDWINNNERRLKENQFSLKHQKIFKFKLKLKAFLIKFINFKIK